MSAVLDSLVGTVVDGKYQIVACIGAGGMGTVYRAVHLSLGAPRALKVMRPELARDSALAARFRDEARLAEGLRHPSLVALYDFGELPERGLYIVTELVRGATVAELLQGRGMRFCSDDAARFVGQVAEGLALAHRRGVVHRDISPENIMLAASVDGDVTAKLLDFGIAKDTHGPADAGSTGTGWRMGKMGFSSPEQMGLLHQGEAIDSRSDVFSLAAVAYVMLAGRLPWRSDGLQAYTYDLLLRPQPDLEAEIRRHAPRGWSDLFVAALARSRDERLLDMTALRERLAEVAREARVSGEAEPPPVRAELLLPGAAEDDELATLVDPAVPVPGPARCVQTGPLLVPSAIFTADLAAADWLSASEGVAPQARSSREPERIVFLDDDEALRGTLPRLFDRMGLDAVALSWEQVGALAAKPEPTLVLADPGDGARACARVATLRHALGQAGTRVVLFASLDPWSLRERARELGLSRHVSKEGLAGDVAALVGRLREPQPTPAGA